MDVEGLLGFLSSKYADQENLPATKMISSENREYLLYPTDTAFKTYKPQTVKESYNVLAVDAGSVTLFDTPYWGLGFIKLRARFIHFNPKQKKGVTTRTESRDGFVLFVSDDVAEGDNIVSREFYEKGNFQTREETGFIRELVGELEEDDLLLVDGAFGGQFYEKDILKKHKNTIGVSKRTEMRINRYSAPAFLTLKAEDMKLNDPWYAFPLVKEYPSKNPVAEIMFATFAQDARTAFRVDVPFQLSELNPKEQHEWVRDALSKVSLFSLDPKYTHYPYPLGAVHTDAVMRPYDREAAQAFIEKELEKTDLPKGVKKLLRKDIEIDKWYDRFRRRAM